MAIVLDTSTSGSSNSTAQLTFAHTCTGANLYLLEFVWTNQTSITSCTYGSVTMTKLKESSAITNDRHIYVYGLADPATGANNMVVTPSATGQVYTAAISYTGCLGTQPDASATGVVTVGNTTITGTLTTIVNNCWTAMGVVSGLKDNLGDGSAGANTTWRNTMGSNGGIYDSNGALSIGSHSLVATLTASQTDDMAQVIVSLAPFPDTTTNYLNDYRRGSSKL